MTNSRQTKPYYATAQKDMYRAAYDTGAAIIYTKVYESKRECKKQAEADFGLGNFDVETIPLGSRVFIFD